MKELAATAAATVDATPEQCLALLIAVDGYPNWYPEVVRHAEVIERDGAGKPSRARATVHVAVGPLVRDFDLPLAVSVSSLEVKLSRTPHEPSDPERFEITWEIAPGPPTGLELRFEARLDVPRLLPVGSVGESLAQGFVDAASRALAGCSPNASASSS